MDKRAVRNNIFVMGLVLLLALITCLGAPPNWVEQAPLSDSTYYLYFGQAMEKGLVMYADIFDHKGPLLFVINYILCFYYNIHFPTETQNMHSN